jgi:hypothetical protein
LLANIARLYLYEVNQRVAPLRRFLPGLISSRVWGRAGIVG